MSHDKYSEQVFDSLVEELVTGQHPPDLSARILAAWQQEQLQSGSITKATISSSPTGKVARRSALVWMVAAAAVLLLGYVGWKWISPNHPNNLPNIAIQDAQLPELPGNQPKEAQSPTADSTNAGSSTIAQNDGSKLNNGPAGTNRASESPEKIEAPFALDADLVKQSTSKPTPATANVVQLTNEDVVSELDRRLNALWSSVDVAASTPLMPAELAHRVSMELTGQQLSDAQIKQLLDSKSQQLDKSNLVSSATDSMAFKRWWSQRMVQLWLGRSTQGTAESTLVESLAGRMNQEKQWNVIVADLIGGEIQDDSLSNQFLRLLAGGENHRLVECLGKNFLNQQVTCMRCHKRPDSENIPANQQAAYWSLVALLKGVEGKGSDQLVNDRQMEIFAGGRTQRTEPGVYFELPSGVLQQAFAQLPSGQDWHLVSADAPRAALGQWISTSNDLDRATVNSAWQLIFGRPLVPLVPAVDAVGLEHRQQILEFLAQQFDSADHDLGRLVGWIVSSRSFAAQPTLLSRDQWQDASDQQLESQQIADLVFATGARPATSPQRKRLQEHLDFVAQWRSESKPKTLLAQPAQIEPNKGGSANAKSETTLFSTSFAIHGLRHTSAQESYVDRLLRAEKLNWSERVQHVVGLSSMGLANDDVQYSAKELLQLHTGDAKAALLDLMWAVESSRL